MDFNEKKDKVYTSKDWIKSGIFYGIGMFLITSIILPYVYGEEITSKTILVGIVSWTIGGFLFGFIMKLFVKNKKK